MNGAPVLCDLRAVQSPDHRGRGIGRWSYELACALERVRPDLVAAYLLDPGWPPPGAVDELLASGKLAYLGTPHADEAAAGARAWLCCSPFELDRTLGEVRPELVDRCGLAYAAIAYDLIPLRHPEEYLRHPAQRRRYGARLEVLRTADAVLAISRLAGADVRRLLNVAPERCHVVGTGVSRRFVPPGSRDDALATLRAAMPELRERFVLYPAGNDGRKNIEGLIAAFAKLPEPVLRRHQLVVVGDLPPLTANHYRHLAREAGVEDRLLLTGFVPDERLVELYQATDLFVFPSLAEGYGLPVAEALACGAVAAVSDRPPFDELVPAARARFDPADPRDMAATIARCLTDEALRHCVLEDAAGALASWDEVAERVAAVLDRLATARPRPWRPRAVRRIAVVSPLPPVPSGVAGYSAKLVEAMRAAIEAGTAPGWAAGTTEIDCFADGLGRQGPAAPVDGVAPRPAGAFEAVDHLSGGYDRVLYVIGNSEFHSRALAALRRRKGVVLCHDVRLSGLLALSQDLPGAVPGGLRGAVARAYPQLPAHLASNGWIDEADRDRYGLLLTREVLAHTDRLLVTSEAARSLAELDAGPELAGRIGVVPFAMARLSESELRTVERARRAAAERRAGGGPFTVACFGLVDPSKRPHLLVEALALLVRDGVGVRLRLVGPVATKLAAELAGLAASRGVGDRVEVTNEVSWDEYLRLLGETDLAVQLRSRVFGEASGTVSEACSAGVATVVSDLGWMHELPDGAVRKVARDCGAAELAAALSALLADEAARARLGAAATAYANERTFDLAARAVLAELAP
jgi:glycosyltransferase involved in cell wall biosynthesis